MESILIIDDDISLCSMLKEYLALQKMRLTITGSGAWRRRAPGDST